LRLEKINSKKGQENSNNKILLVDDDADIRAVLSLGLKKEGFNVDDNGDPKDALAKYKPGEYDLLLLDISMPGMNGFQLYREIRKIDKKVRVCFITAFEIHFDEFRRVFPKIHVSCFVQKPVTISKLAQAVREEFARPPPQDEEVSQPIPKAQN